MFEIADRLITAAESVAAKSAAAKRAQDNTEPEIAHRIAIATAISIDGSAPRTIGTSMAFDGDQVIGSIAGGCVEGAVVEVCLDVLADGIPRTVEYGFSDETAFDIGLTCGGRIRIHVRLMDDAILHSLRAAVSGEPTGITSVVRSEPDAATTSEGNASATSVTTLSDRLTAELDARIATGESGLSVIDCDGDLVETFFEVSVPPAHLLIFGAMDFSTALAAAAIPLGYRVTVCDPRPLFATARRFPGADVVVEWPTVWFTRQQLDERAVICILSHDARFDAELVALALASPAGFVGAMGSRATHDRRLASLRERGVTEAHIARLHSPIGLDIGASTVEETAIAILGDVIAARSSATARPLMATTGAIHRTERLDAQKSRNQEAHP